ncbi:hypothetical protein QFC24_005067 [Naganishia onofrii]|uniref:Uncharacterized protein n=1 Tax=Naganishia onofrii TaxID=1851511 RepID=A0ACC2XBR1_9TREE|nr:hypothetical protein QFC24_005067 [Naganishia onofrii]
MTSSSVPIPSLPTAHNAANAVARHVREAANEMTQDSTSKVELGRPPSHTGLQEEGDGGATVGPSIEEREKKREHHPAGGTRKVRTVPPFAAFDPPSPVMSPRILPTDADVPRLSESASPVPAQGQGHTHRQHHHYPHLSLSSDLTRTLSPDECQGGADQPPPWWTFAKPGRWKQVQTLHNAWVEQMMANEELRKESEHLGRDYFASKRGSAVGSTIGMGQGEEGQVAGGQQGENETNELGTAANAGETPLRHPHLHALRPPIAMSGLQSSRAGGSYFHLGKLRRRSVSQEDFNNPDLSSSPSPFHLPAGATTGGAGTPQTQFHTPDQTPTPLGMGTPSSAALNTAAPGAQQKGRHRARFKAMSLPVSRRQSTDNTRAGTPNKPSAVPPSSAVGGVYQPPNTSEPETSEDASAAENIGHKATGHQVTGFVLGPPIEYHSESANTTGEGSTAAVGPPQSSSAAWSVRAVDGEQQNSVVGSDASVPSTPPTRTLMMQQSAQPTQKTESRSPSQNITSSPVQLTTSPGTASSQKAGGPQNETGPMSPHRKGHHPNFSITLPPSAFAPPPSTETTRLGGTATGARPDTAVPLPPPPPMFPQPHRHLAQAPPTPLGWDAPWRERDLVGRRFERVNRAEEGGKRGSAGGNGKRDSGYGGTGGAVSDPWLQPFEETAFDAEEGEDECSVGSLAGGRGWRRSEEHGAGHGGSESSGGALTAGMGISEKNLGRHRSSGGNKARSSTRTGKNQSGKVSKWAMLRHSAVKNPPGTRRAKLRKYFIFDARSTLYLRLATLVGIATALGLGAKLFSLENAADLDGILGSAPILSISYGSVSAIHCLVVMYREAFGKPIGLWGLRSKMTWVCLDLFFIALWSSCLSLTISDYMSSPLQCSSLNPWWTTGTYTITLPEVITKSRQKDKMCDRQAALIGFVLFTLIMYVINMVISLFRIFERLSTVAKSYEKSRVGQLV